MDSKTTRFASGRTGIVLLILFAAAIIAAQARGTGYDVDGAGVAPDRAVAVIDIAPMLEAFSNIDAVQPFVSVLVDDSIEIDLDMQTRQLTVSKRLGESAQE